MMTANRMTHPASFVFCCSKRQGAFDWSVFFRKSAILFIILMHLRVPELIIKGVEGLNLVSDEELFIGTVNETENVGFS